MYTDGDREAIIFNLASHKAALELVHLLAEVRDKCLREESLVRLSASPGANARTGTVQIESQ